ncbi:MAG: MGMT family protein [Candidatus Thorarchaeota archaeon]|nr:MAG: MGMT family protein [Candidatus Thorarchaeota archaeon]
MSEALKAVNGKGLERDDDRRSVSILEKVFQIIEGREDVDISGVKLDFADLTKNQISVIKSLLRIPRGNTITYGDLARKAGLPKAARFVGNVMAQNRFAPIVPCHRVVSTSGLGGYGFGLEMKKELLAKEGAYY